MLRPFALGCKNWLFFGAASGGHVVAIRHSLAATCVLYAVNLRAYFDDILRRIKDYHQTDCYRIIGWPHVPPR